MPVRSILLAASLLFAMPAFAQQPIEAQMTPEEFAAAGLDKLSAGELARLNAWLNRTIEGETTRATTETRAKVAEENRGFSALGPSEPIEARISGGFDGFARNREYTLDNGQVWRQIDAATLAGVRRDSPSVRITPSVIGKAWYLTIEGYNTRAKVVRVR